MEQDNEHASERLVVALTGGREGETLVRRAAQIASRSGAELFAVHVTSSERERLRHPEPLEEQRALVTELGGTFHELTGRQVGRLIIEFARSVNATQLVLGVSRTSRFGAALAGPGTAATVLREAGDIDVHIVPHSHVASRALPRLGGALTWRRRVVGFGLTLLGLPPLTWLLSLFRGDESITNDVLAYQLFIVVIALIGGIWPAVVAAISAGLLLDYFVVEPLHTVEVADPSHLLSLVLFTVVAVLVSVVVDQAARRSRTAARAAAESQTLSAIAGGVLRGQDALEALVIRLRDAFGMTSVMLRQEGDPIYVATDSTIASPNDVETTLPLGNNSALYLRGQELRAADRRILEAFLSQMRTALEQRQLRTETQSLRFVAEADRLRTALLAAVGHDLRRPLATATAAVSSLRATDVSLAESDRDELLETAEESLRSLAVLVTDLLDASRLQAGVLGVSLSAVELESVVGDALDELGLAPGDVRLELDETVGAASADAALLQRAVVNLLSNALRFSPPGTTPVIVSSQSDETVALHVSDAGPGIPESRKDEVFAPFQRLGDTDNTTGVGLGLALSRGFVEAMGGTLQATEADGGGLTMTIELAAA